MTYNEFIQNIINTRGQWNIPDNEYFELHHILPRCIGGKGDYKDNRFSRYSKHNNCIWLYPEEHFIAHKLLALENQNNWKLVFAWKSMFLKINQENAPYEPTPEEYATLKKLASEHQSKLMAGKKLSEEHKKKISIGLKNRPTITQEARVKLSIANKGKIHVTNGKDERVISKDKLVEFIANGYYIGVRPKTSTTKAALSKALLRHTVSEATKQKLSSVARGKVWITDGSSDKQVSKKVANSYLNSGWKLGRTSSQIAWNRRKCRCIETGEIFESVSEVKLKYGVHVSDVLRGRRKHLHKLHFEYL